MAIWMQVTLDEYELPLAVADSATELARLIGVTKNAVCTGVYHAKKGGRSRYVKVEEEDDGIH